MGSSGYSATEDIEERSILGRPVPAPNPVRSLSVTRVGFNGFEIEFVESDNETEAQVSEYEWKFSTQTNWTPIALIGGSRYVVTRRGVSAGTYTVQVRAVGNGMAYH